MARLSWVCLILALGFVAVRSNLECSDDDYPKELTGVWIGEDIFVKDSCHVGDCEGKPVDEVSLSCSAILSRRGCVGSWVEACAEGVYSVGDTFIEAIQSYNCTGPGAGTFIDYGVDDDEYYCTSFKVEGKTSKQVYGWPADTPEDAVCPGIDSEVGKDPTVYGLIELTISDEEDLVDKKDWSCK